MSLTETILLEYEAFLKELVLRVLSPANISNAKALFRKEADGQSRRVKLQVKECIRAKKGTFNYNNLVNHINTLTLKYELLVRQQGKINLSRAAITWISTKVLQKVLYNILKKFRTPEP